MREAYEREPAWRDGVRAGLAELLVFLDDEPALARLCLVEALGAGPRVLERRAELLEELAEVVDRGRFVTSAVREPPEVAAEGVVGAVFAVLHTRVLEGGEEPFTDLLGSLMNIVVLPYLGARAASRELSRAAPAICRGGGRPADGQIRDPLAGLNMRLTYRTVRVLVVIGERLPARATARSPTARASPTRARSQSCSPGWRGWSWSRTPGRARRRADPNAWHLTPRGARVERATRPR